MSTVFPTGFSTLASVAGTTKVLADDGSNNGVATVNQILDVRMDSSTTAGRLARYSDTAGTQRETTGLFEDGSGNVGIGTTSPAYPLDVNGTARAQGFAIGSVSSVAYGTFQLYSTANKIRLTYPNVADFDMSLNSAGQFSMLGGNVGIGTTSPTDLLDVNSDAMRLRSSKTPASASAAGNAGEMCWDADFLYVCVSTNQWKRAALSTW